MSERDALSSVIQQERNRKQGLKEDFGLMLPGQKAAARQVAKGLAAGRPLSRQEFEFAKGHQELYGDAVKKMGAQMAGPEFEQIYKLMNLGERGKQAEAQRIQLDNKIAVDIKGLDKNIAQQIVEGVMPNLDHLGRIQLP